LRIRPQKRQGMTDATQPQGPGADVRVTTRFFPVSEALRPYASSHLV